jgi:hypothetical protein
VYEPVPDPLWESVAVAVLEAVPVYEPVPDRLDVPVPVPERVAEGVPVRELVGETEGDLEGVTVAVVVAVGLGEGCNKPCTYRGPAYCVPALVTESHTFVGKLPATVPVRTVVRLSSP